MKKRFTPVALFPALFVVFLVGGLLLFAVTGKDVFARFGVTTAVVIALFWLVFLATRDILRRIHAKLYFDAVLACLTNGGIALLLIYFVWLLLSEMFGVQILGSIPPVKNSKLTILGGLLILLGLVGTLVGPAFRRKNASGRRE